MSYGVKMRIWGDRACFTRPEMKVERVSYDIITPSATRGILEAIYWKPSIRWVVDKIHVLNEIRFESIRRNEVPSKISPNKPSIFIEDERQQRASTILCKVDYIVEAHFKFTNKAVGDDNEGKHLDIFNRRVKNGQCFHRPYFGTREFPVDFGPLESRPFKPPIDESRDLGWMLHDIDFEDDMNPRFFRAEMQKGIVNVPDFNGEQVKA